MRFLQFFLIGWAVILSAAGCSPLIRVYAETEPGTNMRHYRTYDWLDNATSEKNKTPDLVSTRNEALIRAAVDAQMRQRGFKRCDREPDLMLHYHVVVEAQEMYYQDWWCDDEEWHKYGRCERMRKVDYHEGTLTVDMIDTRTGNQVWRGVAVGVLEEIPPEQVPARIDEAVQKIFGHFHESTSGNYE